MKGNFGALALIVIGIIALIVNLDILDVDFAQLLRTWWPIVLVLLGIGMIMAPGDDSTRK
jgi:hypothetical protein